MQNYPLFLNLSDKRVLVIGGGAAAASKVRLLRAANAHITLVAPEADPELRQAATEGEIVWHEREFHTEDLCENPIIVVVSTNVAERDARIAAAVRERGLLVNVVDRPALSDFSTPAIIERGPVTVAISTGGAAPVLARQIRGLIETALPARLGDLASFIDDFRGAVKSVLDTATRRRRFWDRFLTSPAAELLLAGDESAARQEMLQLLNRGGEDATVTRLALIDVGHGDAELLTRRDQRLLQEADLVVHDRAVPAGIVDLSRREAERLVPIGGVVTALTRELRRGRRVVYLGTGPDQIDAVNAHFAPTRIEINRTPTVTPAPAATPSAAQAHG